MSVIERAERSVPAADQSSVPGTDTAQQAGRAACTLDGLRLLFAVDSRFPGLGGAESQALKLAVALRERGAFVEFVTPRVLASQTMEESFHGFTIKRVDYPHVRWIGSLVLMLWFARYLHANRERFDAVHIHITHLLAASAGFARRWTGLPVTTKISGYYEFEGGVLDRRKRFKPLNFILRRGLTHVDHVQTISDQTRDKLLEAGFSNDQIKFIPNGIDTRRLPLPVAASGVITIGYCGRLREVKGVHVLLDAFALLLRDNPAGSLRLSIAGSGETSAALLQKAATLGIGEQIEWLGQVEDTSPFFQALDIYAQPSFAEGLPNSVMEAMVEQRPVVASDIGGNSDLIEDEVTGLLFTAGDATMLAYCLQRLIDEPQLRHSLAQAGRQLIIDRYGFDRVVEQLVELYRAQQIV
jgi:glycosyltransferase involved in cell wall biosynthesis